MDIPDDIAPQGTLKEAVADRYLDDANNFLMELDDRLSSRISKYRKNLDKSLPKDISADFYASVDGQLEQLKQDIENRAETLMCRQSPEGTRSQ